MLVNTLHHSVGGYTGTNPSHPSSSAFLSSPPPSDTPHNLSLQLELAFHTHLLYFLLQFLLPAVMDLCLTLHLYTSILLCHPLALNQSLFPVVCSFFSFSKNTSILWWRRSILSGSVLLSLSALCNWVARNVNGAACLHVDVSGSVFCFSCVFCFYSSRITGIPKHWKSSVMLKNIRKTKIKMY